MKKVILLLMLVVTAATIKAQSGANKVGDLGPVLYEAVSKNNGLLIEAYLPDFVNTPNLQIDKNGADGSERLSYMHDLLLGQVANAHGDFLKVGVDFNKPYTAATVETALYNRESNEMAIVKYVFTISGNTHTISAIAQKINGRWYIVDNIVSTDQKVSTKK